MEHGRELIKKALTFKEYYVVPIETRDVLNVYASYPAGRSTGIMNKKGKRTDIWGCEWEAL